MANQRWEPPSRVEPCRLNSQARHQAPVAIQHGTLLPVGVDVFWRLVASFLAKMEMSTNTETIEIFIAHGPDVAIVVVVVVDKRIKTSDRQNEWQAMAEVH